MGQAVVRFFPVNFETVRGFVGGSDQSSSVLDRVVVGDGHPDAGSHDELATDPGDLCPKPFCGRRYFR